MLAFTKQNDNKVLEEAELAGIPYFATNIYLNICILWFYLSGFKGITLPSQRKFKSSAIIWEPKIHETKGLHFSFQPCMDNTWSWTGSWMQWSFVWTLQKVA